MLDRNVELIDGRYLVQERAPYEGPVELYYALDRLLQRIVLVQVLSSDHGDLVRRFRRHRQVASTVHHCGVFELYDAGEWDGHPFSVMERDAGAVTALARSTPVELAAALRITREAAEGLQCCRHEGLYDWAFSCEAVRLGTTGAARLLLLEGLDLQGDTYSMRSADDPPVLADLLARLLRADSDPAVASTLPPAILDLLDRMSPGREGSFHSAGEVADAIARLENALNQPTEQFAVLGRGAAAALPSVGPAASRMDSRVVEGEESSLAPTLPAALFAPPAPSAAVGTPAELAPAVPISARPGALSEPRVQTQQLNKGPGRPALPFVLGGAILLLALLVGAVIAAALGRTTTVSARQAATPVASGGTIVVPDLRGKTLVDAQALTAAAHFTLNVGTPVTDPVVPRDAVASQVPPAGSTLRWGSAITVSLSLGPPPQEEPPTDTPFSPTPVPTMQAPAQQAAPAPPPASQPSHEHSKGKPHKGKGDH